jgi:hypothetical protein
VSATAVPCKNATKDRGGREGGLKLDRKNMQHAEEMHNWLGRRSKE